MSPAFLGPPRRLAVVTGAGSGVGLATVRALRDWGTPVIATYRSPLALGLAEMDGVRWVRGDVGLQDTWDRIQEACLEQDPDGADALIACAAEVAYKPFLEFTIEDWRHSFETNVLGVFRAMRVLLPGMVERRRGAMAICCSVNSYFTEAGSAAYSVSKAALMHLARSAGLEYARYGIRINALCPGIIDTPMQQRVLFTYDDPEATRREWERLCPTGKFMTAEEVAAALCFLVSEGASGFVAAAPILDHGLTSSYDFDFSD